MILNSKQKRVFSLAILIFPGKQVSAKKIINNLDCAEATLTRCLRELRESYSLTIKYSKSTHSYQLIDPGRLTNEDIAQMQYALDKQKESEGKESTNRITSSKRTVTLSLPNSVIAELDRLAVISKQNRSKVVEMLIYTNSNLMCID